MPKLVLARGDISPTDELLIVLSEPDNEPAAVLIHWPSAASVASPAAFQPRLARSLPSWLAPPYGSHSTRPSGCKWNQNPWWRLQHQGFCLTQDSIKCGHFHGVRHQPRSGNQASAPRAEGQNATQTCVTPSGSVGRVTGKG
jgi:hypothetical protein